MTITEYQEKYRISLNKLALRAGVSASSLTRMMHGPRCTVTPETAAKISAATNGAVTVQEILFPHGLPTNARMAPKKGKNDQLR